jgi:RHS repeat-associated protein
MAKPPLRTKSIGFKVSEEEYARLETAAQASGRTLGEWCREVVLANAGCPILDVLCQGWDSTTHSQTDSKNQTIQYVYDALHRLSSKTYPDTTAVEYAYDLAGKVQQVSDPTGTYGFSYDNMGRLIGTSTQYAYLPGFNFQNAYTYDAASNRTSLTAPDGSVSTYGYDSLNRLNGLANSWAGSFGFSYDALSRRTQLTRSNGINTNYGYDSVSHLLSVLHQAGANTLDGASYTYDPAGNRTAKTNDLNAVTSNYSYDPLYELTQVTQGSSTTETYSYDPVGNRLSSLGVPTYSYNSSNELTSNSSGSYSFDANGNTLSDASGKSYTWDFENRLVQAVNPGVGTTTFRYDPFGRRIQKSGPLGTTNYLYDGYNVIEDLDNSGNVLARYTQGTHVDEWLAELRSGTSSYYERDGLGSVTSLSNSAGALANTYTYDSYGKVMASTGTLANPFQYTGRESDQETGLYYDRARYYDPAAGRFLSEDPIGFHGGIDFYAYVANNPIIFTDPSGLQHTPGGPWHPDPWINFRCLGTDDCATLSSKIEIFKSVIASHLAWDAAHGVTTHTDNQDIPNFVNGLNNCIALHQAKCTNKCPKFQPVPEPEPEPQPIAIPPPPPPVVTFGIGGTIILILIILGSPVGV